MTAAEWNAKHPIGTRVLVKEWEHDVLFTVCKAATYHGGFSSVYCWGTGGLVCDRLIPISAYPGDIYTGKPLKKVRTE